MTGPLTFVHVQLLKNRSEFVAVLKIRVTPEGQDYVIDVLQAIAIAITIAYLSELVDPIRIALASHGRTR
jgi:hypothetical protein